MNETILFLFITTGLIVLALLFLIIRKQNREVTKRLRDIHLSETIKDGFIVRFPRKSPFIVVIHKKDCPQARLPREANKSSSWIGYFHNYRDAERYSSLIQEIVSKNKPNPLTITNCSNCNPQKLENILIA
jgi:hypothetical protein